MRQQARRQKSLFEEEIEEKPTPQLPTNVQHEVTQRLRRWIQALAKAIG